MMYVPVQMCIHNIFFEATNTRPIANVFPGLFPMQGDKPGKGKSCCRCNPKDVIDAIKLLSPDQKARFVHLVGGKFSTSQLMR